jgi:hypothetical protein
MRTLTKASPAELAAARKAAHAEGPIALVLSKMAPEGYWENPGAGYYPKYTSTMWSITLLGQLGASIAADPRIQIACNYILDHSLTEDGIFTVNGLPSGTADCLQGNYLTALLDVGCTDARLDGAFEWMARTVTGEGIAPLSEKSARLRYYAGKCGPNFACGSNNKLPCAWGAVKIMLAFGRLPKARQTPVIERAIIAGVDFLFSRDPADADYPCGYAAKPSGNWWKFGFPIFYITDMLQNVEALASLGYGQDKRLARALDLIESKRDDSGRWPLEYDYTGKTWGDFGAKKQPNKWVTLRALRVLKAAGR